MALDDGTRAALGATIERLLGVASGVAWTRPENLHVTLKFLGQVDESVLEPLASALEAAARSATAFDGDVCGLGAFPTLTRPRVIWAGVTEGAPALAALAGAVECGLEPLGFAPEGRPFSAHVTLGRVREPRRDAPLEAALSAAAAERFGALRVDRLALMRSDLSPRGARYTEVARFLLSPRPASP